LVSKETIQDMLGLTDLQVAQAICMGIAMLIKAKAEPEQVLEFLESLVNTIRLAEAERVPVRDEGAN
jgi:hypothetical protein